MIQRNSQWQLGSPIWECVVDVRQPVSSREDHVKVHRSQSREYLRQVRFILMDSQIRGLVVKDKVFHCEASFSNPGTGVMFNKCKASLSGQSQQDLSTPQKRQKYTLGLPSNTKPKDYNIPHATPIYMLTNKLPQFSAQDAKQPEGVKSVAFV